MRPQTLWNPSFSIINGISKSIFHDWPKEWWVFSKDPINVLKHSLYANVMFEIKRYDFYAVYFYAFPSRVGRKLLEIFCFFCTQELGTMWFSTHTLLKPLFQKVKIESPSGRPDKQI